MIQYKEFRSEYMEQVKELLREEGWNSYLADDERLRRAFEKSLYILGAFDGEALVGYIRLNGDGEYSVTGEDLIVAKPYRRQKIGTKLFQTAWDKFKEVRTFLLVTDLTDEADNRFYQSFGMKRLEEGHMTGYFR